MSTAQVQDVILAEKVHEGYIQNIVHNLNQSGQYATHQDVTPVTHETPLPQTKELKSIGAQIIGNENLQSSLKDLGYVMQADIGRGEVDRTTESKNPLKILINKLKSLKNKNGKIVGTSE